MLLSPPPNLKINPKAKDLIQTQFFLRVLKPNKEAILLGKAPKSDDIKVRFSGEKILSMSREEKSPHLSMSSNYDQVIRIIIFMMVWKEKDKKEGKKDPIWLHWKSKIN